MTREVAKRVLKSLDYYLQNRFKDYGERNHDAMIMAINALEQEPCNKTQMIDKSNFSQEQYKADLECAYDCGKSVLDKIRAEILKLDDINPDYLMDRIIHISRNEVLQIIDKYRK